MATILLVDDNAANRVLASKMLRVAGHEVLEAVDAPSGVALALERLPDLVLMDLALPTVDGWEALRLLRADARTNGMRVIAVTAHAMVGDREKALAAGFDGYLSKPIDVGTFAQTVAGFLALGRVG